MKVWVVISTWYKYGDADCPMNEVQGVFSTKEKAQEYVNIWNEKKTGADYYIDSEYEVDFMDFPIGYKKENASER